MSSWRQIAQDAGEEGVDVAEKWFVDICRLATQGADVEARLSPSVFAVYWSEVAPLAEAGDFMGRWFPMEVKTPSATLNLEAAWSVFEVSRGESSREVFDRVAEQVSTDALPRGWDGQVG